MILTEFAALSLAEIERMFREKVQGWKPKFPRWNAIRYVERARAEVPEGWYWEQDEIPGYPSSPGEKDWPTELEAWAHCPSVTWDEVMKAFDNLPEDIEFEFVYDFNGDKKMELIVRDSEHKLFGSLFRLKEIEKRSEAFKRAVLIASIYSQDKGGSK